MLSISMLLFCIAKLNLILGTLLPTYIRTRQKHQAETTLIQYHNKYKTIINPNGTTDIRQKIANQCYNRTTFFTEGFPSLNESSTLKSAKSL